MTLYEAWKERRNQIQGLSVEDPSDYSREKREGEAEVRTITNCSLYSSSVFTFFWYQFLPRHVV